MQYFQDPAKQCIPHNVYCNLWVWYRFIMPFGLTKDIVITYINIFTNKTDSWHFRFISDAVLKLHVLWINHEKHQQFSLVPKTIVRKYLLITTTISNSIITRKQLTFYTQLRVKSKQNSKNRIANLKSRSWLSILESSSIIHSKVSRLDSSQFTYKSFVSGKSSEPS